VSQNSEPAEWSLQLTGGAPCAAHAVEVQARQAWRVRQMQSRDSCGGRHENDEEREPTSRSRAAAAHVSQRQ
jgi:hypothetical protein